MKRKTTIAIICILAALLLAAPISYAWFNESLRTEAHMTSFVHKSYFESGDGTGIFQFNESYTTDESGRETAVHGVDGDGNTLTSEEGCAFEIKYPVQLYYFAWLQYLGYFNQPTEDGSAVSQVYFYLSADLDMTGWVLPPVGTQRYPFVGNFDGNGHVISNLTVQNVVTGHDAAPGTLNDIPVENFSGAEIVGFFGVVGSLEAGGTVNAASDNGSGSFVVAPGYTYDTAINTLHDFALANVTVKTETSRSLIGIVAGYLNADISNVRVGENGTIIRTGTVAALDTVNLTGNLSDHALIGYTLNKDTSDVVFAEIDTPAEHNSKFNYMSQGASAGFGGSIDMLDMFNRLTNVRNGISTITNTNHTATVTRRYSADGRLIEEITGRGAPEANYYRIRTAANDGSGQYVLSYQYESNTFHYLASTYKNVVEIYETNDTAPAFYIQHNGTYLNLNNNHNGVIATTPTGGNTKWVIDANNHIYTQDNDGNKYYLNANNNSLQIGNTGTTAWTKTADAIRNGNNGPYLQYDNGWKLLADGSTTYYTIHSGNNYLNATGTNSYGTGASAADLNDNGHTLWTFSNTGNNPSGTISTTVNGTTYYLNGQRSGYFWDYQYNLTLSATSTTWSNNGGRLTANNVGILYNNGWQGSQTNNATSLTMTRVDLAHTHTALTFTDTTLPVVNRIEKSEPAEFAYIPLGATTTSPYTVSESNTGYIIGGSHETTSDRKSDIRVSQYGKSNITSGLTNTNNNGQVSNNNVRTVDGSGIHTLTNANISGYARYADAVKQFNTVLNGTTNVYGLHFMDAEISTDNLIVAPTVKLEGTTYTNYQMPEDSIDFLVHQTGYITFFAGTYFTDNNSFFSLYTIERYKEDDAEVLAGTAKVKDIKSIKEIKEIWRSSDQSKDYIYYLKNEDGSYEWTGARTSDYSLAFNTDWITQPGTASQLGFSGSGNTATGRLFYFEIPVDAGEYALGSVEGRIGAYLLYLDIAANAQLVKRTAVTEVFEETTKTYEFPVGVTFRNTAIPETAENTVLEPSALAAMGTGDASVSATVASDTDITVTGGSVTYIEDGVTVNGQTNSDLAVAPVAETTTYIRRTTYFDYNVAKNVYTVTQVVVKKVDNAAPLLIINAWNTGSDWDITSGEATQIAAMEEGVAFNTGSSTGSVPINSGAATTLGYTEVDEVYCYLINVGTEENAQTLRIETPALEGGFTITDLLYEFSYGIKDNDAADGGATIEYDYKSDIDFNNNVEQFESMFAHSNRRYAVTVSTASTVNTKVITGVTDANFTVALTPAPQ